MITPYHQESLEVLERCHQSCRRQSVPVRHVMVADGHPHAAINDWDCDHLVLPASHADNGNTPRCTGAISAINRGYWPILMLDADNWYDPDHVALALQLKRLNPAADVIAMARTIVLPDGTPVPGCPEEDARREHIDTSCYVFYPSSFKVLQLWGMMPPYLGPACDRFIFSAIRHYGLSIAWAQQPTTRFTAHYSWAYKAVGRKVPPDVHDVDWDAIQRRFDPAEIVQRTGIETSIISDAPHIQGSRSTRARSR